MLKTSKLMNDIQWSFISLVVVSLSHLLLRVILGRELGPTGLGIYTLVFTIYLFGTQFSGFGVGSALTKYIAEYSNSKVILNKYISTGLIISIIIGSSMGIILYLLSGIISINIYKIPEMSFYLKLIAFCLPFIAVQKAVLGTMNGFRKMKVYAAIDILGSIFTFIISIVLVVILKEGVQGAIFSFVFSTITIGIVSFSFIRKYITSISNELNKYMKQILSFGFYVTLSNSIGMINSNIDSLMIGKFMGEAEVGYYAISIILTQALVLIPAAIQRITTATIANYYGKKEYATMKNHIKNVLIKTYIVTILFSTLIAVAGQTIIIALFGESYLPAYIPALILIIGYAINVPVGAVGGALGSMGKIKVAFHITLLAAFINILLNFLLIPKYGLIGASSATSLSHIVSTIIYLSVLKKVTNKLV